MEWTEQPAVVATRKEQGKKGNETGNANANGRNERRPERRTRPDAGRRRARAKRLTCRRRESTWADE